MWKKLAQVALQNRQLIIAERCYAALGDIAKSRYMRGINELADKIREENPMVRTVVLLKRL